MSRVVPSQDEAHLIVAGIRVQAHKGGRPPLLEDVAMLLAWPADSLRVMVVELEELGILRQLTNAFETRLDIEDYGKVEDLPKEGSGARLSSEVEEFRRTFREKQEDIRNRFGGGLTKTGDDKMNRLEDELKKFRNRGGGPPKSTLGDPPQYPYEDND